MIAPRKVKRLAKKNEKENLRFRTFLKCNADEETLDRQFKRLHEELFANYDCGRCRNCCKMYPGGIPAEDIERDANYLGMTKEDGNCALGECKPENCKKYPYTDQPKRLSSLYSVLEAVEVCPVAFEIYERLKEEYETFYRDPII